MYSQLRYSEKSHIYLILIDAGNFVTERKSEYVSPQGVSNQGPQHRKPSYITKKFKTATAMLSPIHIC